MKILIATIPHSDQRYPTVGDWFVSEDTLHIRVSGLPDIRHMQLIAVHELIEAILCMHREITQEQIDEWDFNWTGSSEPGDSPLAPYYLEHTFATSIERLLAEALGCDWRLYSEAIDSLP
ncbi:MAG: hypothetical protein ACREBW_01945 [Candidatus Micrarchaeaceae archaeon]